MSRAHDIDNERPLDSYESLKQVDRLEESAREPQTSPSCSVVVPAKLSSLNSPFHPSLRREQQQPPCDTMSDASMSDSKGKGVSKPMLIQGREAVISKDDILSQGSATPSPLVVDPVLDLNLSPLSLDPLSLPASSFDNSYFDPLVGADGDNIGVSSGKGKARELPPILPPLSFFPTDYSTENFEWPSLDLSPIAGPSSYGSGSTIEESESSPSTSTTPGTEEPTAVLAHVPSRCRSLSNLSTRSGRSLSALSLSKVKVKFTGSKAPGNLARKLLFRKRDGSESPESSARDVDGVAVVMDTDLQGCYSLGQGNCLMPWTRDLKSRASVVESPFLDMNMGLGSNPILSMYPANRPSDAAILRAKSRSYSSPLPTSAFDIVPITPVDIFAPTPVSIPDYFDEYLPREVRLHILAILVELYEAEHLRNIRNGTWTVLKASSSRHRWVGRERGVRELFKLCRVSKSWRTLVFDGQLWAELDLRSFPKIPPSVLAQLSESAGAFIKHIDFTGHTELFPSSLLDITTHLCLEPTLLHNSHTHLTTVKLHGCTALTTSSLHELLTRSPSLQKLCLKGLTAVTNTTCEYLSACCLKISSLDMSRCPNVNGDGIRILAAAALARKEPLRLTELRLSGLRRITDEMMELLGKAAPDLEVLDLSYARDLHNSAVDAFVACTEDDRDAAQIPCVQLTAREAGRDPADPSRYWRRVTHLRHLSLSSCLMLTDHACSHLAHAVPRLEFFEMAGIGADLRDGGLVRLLETTPFIRRLDLEDACDITDDVLLAITPDPAASEAPARGPPPPPRPGHALEHLTISYASNITNDALTRLMRGCTLLRVLEADNTRLSGRAMGEFVELARARRLADSRIVAIDCRGVGEHAVKDVAAHTRARHGWRAWEARKLGYLDARDAEGLSVGQDECDPLRVVLKTFYSWQTVDAVRAAREKRRNKAGARRGASGSGSSGAEEATGMSTGRMRWWSPSRRSSGATSPAMMTDANDRDGCMIM